MSGVINAPSRVCHMSGNIMWSVGNKFLYTLKFFCRWVCPGICYTEVLGSQKLVEVRSAANSVCFIRATEDFYGTQIKTRRFHTSSLSMTTPTPFLPTPQVLRCTYTVSPAPSKDKGMYAVGAMNSNGEKHYSSTRHDFTRGKCYTSCSL